MKRLLTTACLSVLLSTSWAAAQDITISLELNRASASSEGGCQVVFFGQNGLDQDFEEVTWRLAVFGADGVFRNLLALPLGSLSAGKRRVVQYNLPSACSELSEIIVNDVASCKLAGAPDATSDVCLSQLTVTTRTEIGFGL
ncbi:hypothetical protein [Tateyamaria sp. ANG-S1]|uniref:hypothetical protein n=1 Tax=Tateyamaria sp. ANG-S1 TaxID=1577905 RepID=UPI00057EF81C|nr:hypothetical protein [Tateyamaria sp. ANG-S1]KIC47758.1 hypothetical protein RA29_19290 [Tateyamaria sp. ANG-S1]